MLDAQASLQANKATFFFRLVRLSRTRLRKSADQATTRNVSWRKSTPAISRKRRRSVMSRYRLFSVLTLGQLKLRLKTLLDKKKVMQSRGATASKISASFITLEEGLQQFNNDLNKLQVKCQAIDTGAGKLTFRSNSSKSTQLPSQRY